MVEDERGRQADAAGLGEAVAELDGAERVEPELPEGPFRIDALRRGVSEYGRDLRLHEVQDDLRTIGLGSRGHALGEGAAGALGAACGHPYESAQQGGE